jgi:signal transduction histidine kinase
VFSALARPKSIRLEWRLEQPAWSVLADRGRALQVLSNLVGNAIKFTPEGGAVHIAARADGTAVRFAVRDSGPGITPEHLPHVFDRFWKADRAMTRGTGLGLFIAKGVGEAHGGRIWVESEPGRGAVFYFTLPIVPVPGSPAVERSFGPGLTSNHGV